VDFTSATAITEQSSGLFSLTVPDGWQQGRGAFGGLVLAATVRAIEASEPEKDRKLRSVTAEIAGPVLAGEAEIQTAHLRRGNGLSSWNATLLQQGQGLVRTSAVLARARNTEPPRLHTERPRPALPWKETPNVPEHLMGFAPVFTKHLDFRLLGPGPFTGAKEPVSEGWVRFATPPASLGAAEVVALADAWWPAVYATSTVPRPVGTVAFSLQYFPPEEPFDPAVPFHYRARVLAEQDGYLVEMRELWTEGGRLVALNQQTIAWIR
jgi:hypothetical protein